MARSGLGNYMHSLVQQITSAKLPTAIGNFVIYAFWEIKSKKEHAALVMGAVKPKQPVLVRVHSRCLTGDVFSSLRCDCQDQLRLAMRLIAERGCGVIVYLNQEGRDIGIIDKIKSYALQDQGLDTVEANLKLGYQADERDYAVGADILQQLGVSQMELMTNNPAKIEGIGKYGLTIVKRVPLIIKPNQHNCRYLSTKRDKLGHLLH